MAHGRVEWKGKRLKRMAYGMIERMAGDRQKAGAKAGAAAKKI